MNLQRNIAKPNPTFTAVPRETPIRINSGQTLPSDPIEDQRSLPVLATANDAREFVRLLSRKPFGLSIVEAMSAEPKRIFEQRKIAAYEFWGFIKRVDDRLHLTELGREFAARIAPEGEIFATVLRLQPLYREALRHFHEQDAKVITRTEVVAYWRNYHRALWLSERDERDMEATIVTFFSLCHAADLGTATVGKRGQLARLRIDPARLRSFISERPSAKVRQPSPIDTGVEQIRTVRGGNIYISALATTVRVRDQMRELLVLAGQASHVDSTSTIRELTTVSAEDLRRLGRYSAALMLYDGSDLEGSDGSYRLRPGPLVELNIIRAVTKDRVVNVWVGPTAPPPDVFTPAPYVLKGPELDWTSGLDIVRSLLTLALPAA